MIHNEAWIHNGFYFGTIELISSKFCVLDICDHVRTSFMAELFSSAEEAPDEPSLGDSSNELKTWFQKWFSRVENFIDKEYSILSLGQIYLRTTT